MYFTFPCSVPLHNEVSNNNATQTIQVNVDIAPEDQRKKDCILWRLTGANQCILAMFVFFHRNPTIHTTLLLCFTILVTKIHTIIASTCQLISSASFHKASSTSTFALQRAVTRIHAPVSLDSE